MASHRAILLGLFDAEALAAAVAASPRAALDLDAELRASLETGEGTADISGVEVEAASRSMLETTTHEDYALGRRSYVPGIARPASVRFTVSRRTVAAWRRGILTGDPVRLVARVGDYILRADVRVVQLFETRPADGSVAYEVVGQLARPAELELVEPPPTPPATPPDRLRGIRLSGPLVD